MEKTMLDYIRETPDTLYDIIDHSAVYTKELVDAYLKECVAPVLEANKELLGVTAQILV